MIKINLLEVPFLISFILISLLVTRNEAAIIHNPKLVNSIDDGFLELKPNGTLILRTTHNNFSNIWQEVMIFKNILNAIRLMPMQTKNTINDLNQKIYGEGVEHKFPPFLESVIQRIQTYFSIYKYTDTSQPMWEDKKTTITATTTMKTTPSSSSSSATSSTISETTLTLGQKEINVNRVSGLNRNNASITVNMDKFEQPLKTSTQIKTTPTTTIVTTFVSDENEGNEFIEIKNHKLFDNKKS